MQLMTEKEVESQTSKIQTAGFLYIALNGFVACSFFGVLSSGLVPSASKNEVGLPLLFLTACMCFLCVDTVVKIWGLGKTLGLSNESFWHNGKHFSACGYANELMNEIHEFSGKVYKDGVVNQPREFTMLDLWALKHIHTIVSKEYQCKELYIKA